MSCTEYLPLPWAFCLHARGSVYRQKRWLKICRTNRVSFSYVNKMMMMKYSGAGPGHLHAFVMYRDVEYSMSLSRCFLIMYENNS